MTEQQYGKVTVITGAGGGIGRACARALSGQSSNLMLVDISEETLEATTKELREKSKDVKTSCLVLDVTNESDMTRLVDETLARFERIDNLIAAAGILRIRKSLSTVAETSLEEWEAVIGANLTGAFLSIRAVLPTMMAQKSGDIVTISSTSGQQGRPFDAPYSASKFGIIGLSESLAEEVSNYGVRVQTVIPDAVDTPLWEQNPSAAIKPAQILSADRVAQFIAHMLSLPRDAYLRNPVIAPFGGRKKRVKKK